MYAPIWSRKLHLVLYALASIWSVSILNFLSWWINSSHIENSVMFVMTTFAICWPLIIPGYGLFFLIRMRVVRSKNLAPKKTRIAMIVTKAPSEPFSVIATTLTGMLSQKTPHDTWVADEDPTGESLIWYAKHGVKVSCRKGIPEYNRDIWPRRKKCKEGNLAYFYDKFGYKNYDIVVQMDADHVPGEGYLEQMILPFENSKIGYVAAPSICNSNTDNSWSSRARMQAEALFHGPIQVGSNDGWAPVCIGSHYAVRTKALKSIGGIGPELAEDYSTSLIMNSHGWSGVWAYNAKAIGEGPNGFADVLVQDFQWSRSMFIILWRYFPKEFIKLSIRKKVQFTFSILWYPLSAIAWLFSIIVPISVLFTNEIPAKIDIIEFFAHISIPLITMFIIFIIPWRTKKLRPQKIKLISWENALFELARWPWVIVACIDASIALITNKNRAIKVTAKGGIGGNRIPNMIIAPYLLILLVSGIALLAGDLTNYNIIGYAIFTIITAFCYVVLLIFALSLHVRESFKFAYRLGIRQHLSHLLTIALFTFFLFSSALYSGETARSEQYKKIQDRETSIQIENETNNGEDGFSSIINYEFLVIPGDSIWRISEKAIDEYTTHNGIVLNKDQKEKATRSLYIFLPKTKLFPGDTYRIKRSDIETILYSL